MKTGSVCVVIGVILVSALLFQSCKQKETKFGNERIVVLSPEVAEIISALGAEDRIVGISEECDYPASLCQKEKVGKFGSVKVETVVALNPDLIFTSGLEQEKLTQELKKLDLRVEQVYPKSLQELFPTIRRIGALIGKEKEAQVLADSLEKAAQEIRMMCAKGAHPKVYLEIYRDPLMSVSDASFVGELIETAGGDNIFPTLERDYARISAEDVVKAQPEIIICLSQDTLANLSSRKGWQDIPAVRKHRIYFEKDIDPDLIMRASPRTVSGLRKLAILFGKLE